MGLTSPASDYNSSRTDWNQMMMQRPACTEMVDTADGCIVVDKSIRPKADDLILFTSYGSQQIGRLGKNYIICEDGESLEGESLEEVTVIGVITWVITRVWGGEGPTI